MSRDRQPLIFRRTLGSLRPVNEAAEDALRTLGDGSTVIVEIKKGRRNVDRHRLYWKLLTLAAENLAGKVDGPFDAELLHELLKQRLGLGQWVILPSGDKVFASDSTSFHKMTEPEFVKHFERVNAVLASWLGVDPQVLLNETKEAA